MFSAIPGTLSGPNNYSNSWGFNQWSICKQNHSCVNRQESYKYTWSLMTMLNLSEKASDRSQRLETKIQDIPALNYILHWLILSPIPCRGSNYHWHLLATMTFLPFESNLFGLDIFSRADQAKQSSMASPAIGAQWLNVFWTYLLHPSSLPLLCTAYNQREDESLR